MYKEHTGCIINNRHSYMLLEYLSGYVWIGAVLPFRYVLIRFYGQCIRCCVLFVFRLRIRILYMPWRIINSDFLLWICFIRIIKWQFKRLMFAKYINWRGISFVMLLCLPLSRTVGLVSYCACSSSERKAISEHSLYVTHCVKGFRASEATPQ